MDYLDTQPDNERSRGLKKVLQEKALVSLRKNKDRIRKYSYDKEMIELQNSLMGKDFAKMTAPKKLAKSLCHLIIKDAEEMSNCKQALGQVFAVNIL